MAPSSTLDGYNCLPCLIKVSGNIQATKQLTAVERELLAAQLLTLERALDPGLERINWNSLRIPDFVASCNKVSRAPCKLVPIL